MPWRRKEAISPTDFALSVHNSAVGNLTITHSGRSFPPLSAGRDTFQQGLCEVMCLQAGYQRVLMVDFDGYLPEFYHPQLSPEMPTWPYALALVIETGRHCAASPVAAHRP